nr:reverse transcriptase domain-containing protein [Tanacetum cinerariifolium]
PRETSLRDDVIVKGSDEPHLEHDIDPEVQAEIDECIAYADALRYRGIDARVVVEAVNREESETGTRGPVEVRVERVTHPLMPEDTLEPSQEERVVIKGVQREQGRRNVRVESAVTALTEKVAELERDNRRLNDTASVESQRVDRLQRDMSRMQRELRQMKMPNTRSRASMTRGEIEELVARRVAEEMEAREVVMNLKPLNENGDEQELKYATCTLQDSALTWWNSHKRTIGVDVVYAIKWARLMKLMIEVYCLRSEIQMMETELWILMVKGNDLTAYTQR